MPLKILARGYFTLGTPIHIEEEATNGYVVTSISQCDHVTIFTFCTSRESCCVHVYDTLSISYCINYWSPCRWSLLCWSTCLQGDEKKGKGETKLGF